MAINIHALEVAVVVPCKDEAETIETVISDFSKVLPSAKIYVCDNASTDETSALADAAGAFVIREPLAGKGNAVRRLFADVEADIFIMVDGDATYEAAAATKMIELLIQDGCDLINGVRVHTEEDAYRAGHVFGNMLLTNMVKWLFGAKGSDMLSGYKVMSRRFVKSFPIQSTGFEIETELLIHAVEMRVPQTEVETAYGSRPDGSESKLSTVRDGIRIVRLVGYLLRREKPLQFFSFVAFVLALIAAVFGVPVLMEYFETGLVARFPTAFTVVGILILSALSLFTGLILESVSVVSKQARQLVYLTIPKTTAE